MYLHKLQLQNFRKFSNKEFIFNESKNLLIGNNGCGKSSCIEAISLITNGNSPFTNDFSDMLLFESDFFKVEGIFSDKTVKSIIYSSLGTKYLINGKRKGLAKFNSYIKSNLFSPEQIDILMLSPASRRKFLDDLICNIDYEYTTQLAGFSKVLKQRNRLLRRLAENFYKNGILEEKSIELDIWTQKLAQISSDIIFKRTNFIAEINSILKEIGTINYNSSLGLGKFEDMLDKKSLIKKHLDIYEKNSRKEVAIGHSLFGAHRDDWHLFGFNRNIHRFGSRGEKRFIIGSFIFCLQELFKNMLGEYPILILDDLASELDKGRIKELLDSAILGYQQLFISGIEDIPAIKGKKIQF